MKVLVTGGSGFLGRSIVKKAEESEQGELYIHDIVKPDFPTDAHFIPADKEKALSESGPFDVVYHCAGLLGTELLFSHILKAEEVNVLGALKIFEMQKNTGIVLCAGLIDEWLNPYMISKHTAERYGLMYRTWYKTKIVSVRMTHLYGPGQSMQQDKILPTFITKALANEPLVVFGSGDQEVQFLYVEDAADVFVKTAERDCTDQPVIDITSLLEGNTMSVNDCAQIIIELTNSKSTISHTDNRLGQPYDYRKTPVNIQQTKKLFEDLGIIETPFVKGIEKTIQYYEKIQNR